MRDFQGRIVQQPRQRDDPVEPVRRALPALGGAAEPLALADIGPELVEVAAQAVRLDAKLSLEPARGPNRAERQRPERGFGQAAR
jgi:hypothetical protein